MSRVYAELLAVRALALFLIALAASVGLCVTSRGAELRAFRAAIARGDYRNAPTCPTIVQSFEARLADRELDEISDMVASHQQRDLFWVHNDSGDSARIFAVGRDGQLRAEVVLDGVEARDFEDISLHSTREGGVLYVADTGDNLKRRKEVQIHVLPEPHVPSAGSAVKLHRSPRTVQVRYEDGPHDVEAMLVDARGDVYLFNKAHVLAYIERGGIYRIGAEEMQQPSAIARKVSSLPMGPATAAALSPDGRTLVVRNYVMAMWWALEEDETLVQAFERAPCRFRLREDGLQGEALTVLPNGAGFLTLGEGRHATFVRYDYGPPEKQD